MMQDPNPSRTLNEPIQVNVGIDLAKQGPSQEHLTCRSARAEREVDEALSGERDDNSWNWVKKKLGGIRG